MVQTNVLVAFLCLSMAVLSASRAQANTMVYVGTPGVHTPETMDLVVKTLENLVQNISESHTLYSNGFGHLASFKLEDNSTMFCRILLLGNACTSGRNVNTPLPAEVFKALVCDLLEDMKTRHTKQGFSFVVMANKGAVLDYFQFPTKTYSFETTGISRFAVPKKGTLISSEYCEQPIRQSNLIPGADGLFDTIEAGECLVSPNGRFALKMGENCLLSLFDLQQDKDQVIWTSNTVYFGFKCSTALNADGDLLVYDVLNATAPVGLSISHTASGKSEDPVLLTLSLQDDGDLVLLTVASPPQRIWSSVTKTPGLANI